jgi:hypothetical protein
LNSNNYDSFYLGKHKIRNGSRSQKFRLAPSCSRDFYRSNKDIFKTFEIDVEKCIVAEGNWDTNKGSLQKIMTPEISMNSSADFQSFKKEMMPIVKQIIKKIPFSTLPSCNFCDCETQIFSKNTKPGFRYEEILKLQDKDSASSYAKIIAKRRWDYIEKCGRKNEKVKRNKIFPSIYTIGARNKRSYIYEEDDKVASRAVHMPEFHTEICSSPWIDGITEYIKEESRGSLFIGNSFVDFQRLKKVVNNRACILEGDWKGFDSTLFCNIIILGVSIMRCFYDLDSNRIDKHFISIGDTVLIKDYYTPGGDLYRLLHGLPSGVKSTNLLGSIINLLALGYCLGKKNIKKTDFVVGGDDFIIASDIDLKDSLDDICVRANFLNMEFKFLDLKKQEGSKLDDLPCFFKYVVYGNKPIIPSTALFERAFMPWNNKIKNVYDAFEHLNALLPSLAAPNTSSLLFYSYYSKLYKIIFKETIPLSKIFIKHSTIYNKVMDRSFFHDNKNICVKTSYIRDFINDHDKKLLFDTFCPSRDVDIIKFKILKNERA